MMRGLDVIRADVDEIIARSHEDLLAIRGKRVLVTGGAGFLLSYLVDTLVAASDAAPTGERTHIVVVDNFTTSSRSRLDHLANHPCVVLRDADASTLVLDEHFDLIIHGASIASPIHYRRLPLRTMEVNALGTWAILRAIQDRPDTTFVLMSTSEVYGDPDPAVVPIPETYEGRVSCVGPRAVYDESKRFAETLAMTYFRAHGTRVRIIRPFNVYGPGLYEEDGRVVPTLLASAIRGDDLVLHSDGTPRRAFCYVTDFITSLLRVIVHGRDGEVYNVGDDREEISMRELAERIVSATDSRGAVRVEPSEEADYLVDNPQRRCPDISKRRSLGGPMPLVELGDGLVRNARWLAAVASSPASTSKVVGDA